MILIHSHSFLPQNPKSHFPFFLISVSTETGRMESSRAERDTKQWGVVFFFFFPSTILSHPLSLYGLASLVYLHIVQLFFLVSFDIIFCYLIFILFFWCWWHFSYCNLKAKLKVLDSFLQGMELLFNFLSILPSFLPLCLICFFNIQVLILKFCLFNL
jgi:hypothetical protein